MNEGAVIIAVQRKRMLRAFQRANAISPDKSINPQEHGIRMGFIFKSLVRQRVIVQTSTSKYYFNPEREREVRQIKLQVVAAIMVIFIAVAIILFFVH